MNRKLLLGLSAIVMLGSIGCGDGKSHTAQVDVLGTVTLDGKPLADGEIAFLVTGEAPANIPVKDGAFSGKAFSGKNRVEVRATKTMPKSPKALPTDEAPKINLIPDRYNIRSTMETTVGTGGAKDLKFEVKSK